MGFMQPEIVQCDFHSGENRYGETTVMPADVYGDLETFATECRLVLERCEVIPGKIWGRYSAPGYLDCTDWHGPFDTVEACEAELNEFYADDDDDDDDEMDGAL